MFYHDTQQPNDQPTSPTYQPMPDPMGIRQAPVTQEFQAVPNYSMPPQTPYYTPAPFQKPVRSRKGRTAATIALTILVALVFAVGLFSGWVFANSHGSIAPTTTASTSSTTATGSSNSIETQDEAAIAAVEPEVVQVNVTTAQDQALGSGIIIDSQGDIVTNNHVVNGETSMNVTLYNGQTVSAQVVGTDPSNDLAVIRIQPFANMKVATLGDSSQLAIGEDVLAIGNPLGYTQTATNGVVSALNRSEEESASVTLDGLIQTDAPINPGNSGGALINLQGQVVGIPTLGADDTETHTPANGIGFAIPSNQVKVAVAQILQQAGN
jgi:S1-C subfamily serine protease